MSELRDLYQEVILDHYRHPRHHGRVEDASHEADGFNPLCGDRIHMTIKLEPRLIEPILANARGESVQVSTPHDTVTDSPEQPGGETVASSGA